MYSDGSGPIAGLIITLLVALLIFLVCRELVCWYWKINEAIKQRDDMAKTLKEMKMLMESQSITNAKILLELENAREKSAQ